MINLSFILASVIVVLLPGPGFIYTVSTGLQYGKKKGVLASLGCNLGILPHLIFGLISLVFIQQLNNGFLTVIKILGSGYLMFLGVRMLQSGSKLEFNKVGASSDTQTLLRAVPLNLLNPKLSLFFLSFLPQYIQWDQGNIILQGLLLAGVFTLISTLIFAVYGLLSGMVHQYVEHSSKRLRVAQLFFGVIFIGLSLNVLLSA